MTVISSQKSVQAALHRMQDDLVLRAEKLVLDLNLPKGEGLDKGRTQASKALEVAQSAGTLSVFVNWLRYQAGRERSAEFWSRKTSGQASLARAVTTELGNIQRKLYDDLPGIDSHQLNAATMQAATRFLGYFRRALIGADFLEDIRLEKEKQ
jgi:hypothetical protein